MFCDMLQRIGESGVKEMQERRNAGEEERLWSFSQLELSLARSGVVWLASLYKKLSHGRSFQYFFKILFLLNWKFEGLHFLKKKIGNRCINKLVRAIWKRTPVFFFAMVNKRKHFLFVRAPHYGLNRIISTHVISFVHCHFLTHKGAREWSGA